VTAQAGIDVHTYGMGVAVGDGLWVGEGGGLGKRPEQPASSSSEATSARRPTPGAQRLGGASTHHPVCIVLGNDSLIGYP